MQFVVDRAITQLRHYLKIKLENPECHVLESHAQQAISIEFLRKKRSSVGEF